MPKFVSDIRRVQLQSFKWLVIVWLENLRTENFLVHLLSMIFRTVAVDSVVTVIYTYIYLGCALLSLELSPSSGSVSRNFSILWCNRQYGTVDVSRDYVLCYERVFATYLSTTFVSVIFKDPLLAQFWKDISVPFLAILLFSVCNWNAMFCVYRNSNNCRLQHERSYRAFALIKLQVMRNDSSNFIV